jgi:hypothetical protein
MQDEMLIDEYSEENDILSARIGFIDSCLLLLLGGILTYLSVVDMGVKGVLLVILLVIVISMLRASNIILVWLTIMYNPTLVSGIPIFKVNVAISILMLIIYRKISVSRLMNSATIGLFGFLLYLLFTIIFSPDPIKALDAYSIYAKSFVVMLIFMSVIVTEEEFGRVLKWWAVVAALSIIPAWVHYLLGPNTWLYHAFYELSGSKDVAKGSVNIGREVIGRLVWAGVDANGRGAMLMFPFGLALAFFSVTRFKNKLFWGVVLGSITICILGSFSRSAFMSMCIIVFLYALLINIRALLPMFFMGVVAMLAIFFIPQIRDRIIGIPESIIATGASGRLGFWKLALSRWTESPLLGNGLRDFVITFQHEVHNSYIELLTDGGLIAFSVFCVLLFLACHWAFQSSKLYYNLHPMFSKSIFCGMVGMCAMIGTVMFAQNMILWLSFAACYILYFNSVNSGEFEAS